MKKVTLRIPTADQYAFIELVFENDTLGGENFGPEDVFIEYQRFTEVFKPKDGIAAKTFDTFVEKQLLGSGNNVDTYNAMSLPQKTFVQIVKRALKRIQAKQNKEVGGFTYADD